MENKYGECPKHSGESMIDCTQCAIENGHIFKFDKTHKHYPQPDFDKMWKNITDKLDFPLVYFIEHKETKQWLHKRENRLTNEPLFAMEFIGKDAKAMACLFLHLNQKAGKLKDFMVTEHLFTDTEK